jgi:hypothetical protein
VCTFVEYQVWGQSKTWLVGTTSLEHLYRREIILWEVNPMSDVFQNIDPPPPSPPGECVPSAFGGGEDTLAGWRGGLIFWKTQGTALYSTYVSTLWFVQTVTGADFYWTMLKKSDLKKLRILFLGCFPDPPFSCLPPGIVNHVCFCLQQLLDYANLYNRNLL